jgi:hypothetical protein
MARKSDEGQRLSGNGITGRFFLLHKERGTEAEVVGARADE